MFLIEKYDCAGAVLRQAVNDVDQKKAVPP
jgi:hypothetical protein